MKTALVTGASRGIGAGIANTLLQNDFEVVNVDIQSPETTPDFGKYHFFKADISDKDARANILSFCQEKLEKLDLLVNNAGISVRERKDMLESTESSLDRLLEVNLKGPYFLTQLLVKWMIEKLEDDHKGYNPKIVNIASLTSYASGTHLAEYALSKSAVSMMTKLYADRLAEYGINVYEIRPGIIETTMTAPSRKKYDRFISEGGLPLKRWGTPDDIAKAVLAVASDLLPYSTGEVINVDGGFHLHRL
jgi:NAD(P)-dependent dehydrogenase (short-subunit alcohol dehydrogenase family)